MVNPRFYFLIVCFFTLLQFSGYSQTSTNGYKNLPVTDFKKQLTTAKNVILLDVRTPEEYTKGHLANAVNIDFFAPDFKEQVKKLAPEKPVYIYCAVGGRSAKASTILAGLNRKAIYNMEGGFTAWQKAGYPVQK